MKFKIAIATVLTMSNIQAAVTINSANIQGYNDSNGNPLSSAGILGLLVVDGGNDGFGDILDGTVITNNTILADGNDTIVNIVDSDAGNPIFGLPAQILGTGTSVLNFPLTGTLSGGDQYALYWFPTLTTSSTNFTENDTYGIARNDTWILPADGGAGPVPLPTEVDSQATVAAAGSATFVVQPVPEPTSAALLGLGSLALVARRRRA